MKDIERRVHLLSGVLASPVHEDDYAEKARRVELQRFVLLKMRVNLLISLRRLKSVMAKLEPLSEQHALLKFLRNVEDAKTLSGFVQELAEAISDYQVRTSCPTIRRLQNIHLGFAPTRNV